MEDWALAEVRALLDYVGLRFALCNVGQMNLAGNGPKHWSRHGYLVIA